MVRQNKNTSRITPKGTAPAGSAPTGSALSRQPVPIKGPSPMIVPIIMFGSLGIGIAMILFNYLTEDILGTPNNLYLAGGLGLILVGIISATQLR